MLKLRKLRALAPTKTHDQRLRFESSASGNVYMITRKRKKKKLQCSCPAWFYTRLDCKHIKAVRQLVCQ